MSSGKITLRDYQRRQVDQVYDHWRAGSRNILNVLPTGGGKTVEMAAIASESVVPGVAIAHRKELINQISRAMASFGVRHNIIAADSTVKSCIAKHVELFGRSFYDPRAKFTVSSVDTLAVRAEKLVQWANTVGLWMIDEAHHVLSDNKWGKAVTMFPNGYGVGFTATPVRADRRSLARIQKGAFDAMVVGPTMRELVTAGNLCDYRIFAPPASIDRSLITIGASGDFSDQSMRKVVHESKIVGDIVSSYRQFAAGKRGITFVVDVDQATEVAAAYRAAGVRAECVSAKTPDAVRESLMRKFEQGALDQLVNVDLFGEGLDVPAVEVVSMGRPTESYGLYVQQFGRALRPLQGKAAGIIIDHVGNVTRHGLPDAPRTWTLIADQRGKRSTRDPDVMPVTTCPECFKAYEAVTATCPYCGFKPEPAGRSRPEQVDGDLIELDPSVLAQMRGEVDRIDGQPLIPLGATEIVAAAIRKRWLERQDAQTELRASIAAWAGILHHRGAPDSEIYRRFYHRFGVDIMTAQSLNAADARELKGRLDG